MVGSSSALFSSRIAQTGQFYNVAYDRLMGNTTVCAKVVNFIGNVILLAVLVVGCLAAANVVTGAHIGWAVVALGGTFFAIRLFVGDIRLRKIDLIRSTCIAAALITFGGLAATGILANAYMGYALIGSVALAALSSCCLMIFARRREENSDHS